MKRDRNTFFSNYTAQNQTYIPNGIPNISNNIQSNIPPQTQFGPYTQSSMNSNYYSGPDIATSNDLDNRLSKIERQINRLDNRLTKLENHYSTSNPTEITENNYSNMYML